MSEHVIVHRNPTGETVCSCGELFEPGTLSTYWAAHRCRAEQHPIWLRYGIPCAECEFDARAKR